MKGFLFVAALAALLFSTKALYARWKARRDPVDPKVLAKVRMQGDGSSGP